MLKHPSCMGVLKKRSIWNVTKEWKIKEKLTTSFWINVSTVYSKPSGTIIKRPLRFWKSSGGNVDQCLYTKKIVKGIVYVDLYIDDNIIVGNPEVIDEAI